MTKRNEKLVKGSLVETTENKSWVLHWPIVFEACFAYPHCYLFAEVVKFIASQRKISVTNQQSKVFSVFSRRLFYFSDHENAGMKVVKSPNRSHRPFSRFGSARNKRYEFSRAKIDMHMLRGDFLLSLCNRIPHDFPESQNAYATNITWDKDVNNATFRDAQPIIWL